jgi:hypothetical protein
MNPFESLSDSNTDQLQKYRRFFGQKKDGLLRTIKIEFGDAKADRLNEDMYSKEDVEDFCDYLASSVKVIFEMFLTSLQLLQYYHIIDVDSDVEFHADLRTTFKY